MYRKILVPLDGSVTSEAGLQEAIRLAAAVKAKLCFLHVLTDFPLLMEMSSELNYREVSTRLRQSAEDLLARAVRAASEGQAEAESVLRELASGPIADVIVEEAGRQGCDLIVMGTHGRRGLRRLTLGSDAELVVRHSQVPVLLVQHDEPARS